MDVVLQDAQRGGAVLLPVGGPGVGFGRDPGQNDVGVQDKYVSRRHCVLHGEAGGRVRIVDTSSYGTMVNGARVSGSASAGPGDRIVLGYEYEYVVVGVAGPPGRRQGEPAPPEWLTADYLLLREVGRGGMGIVYEAWRRPTDARCAVKWLRAGGAADAEIEARFRREADLQLQLSEYPGIVTLFDYGKVPETGEMFCAMEYVEGESLLAKLKAGMTRGEVVRLVARVARAVAYAHEKGIVHRDLKPANVMVTTDGAIRLTDFGIAKALGGDGGLTATGIMLGTPGYMAPEQLQDSKRAGPLSDVYGLAAILYNALTGKLPVKGKNMREALKSIEKGDFPRPSEVDGTIDETLDGVLMHALATDPAQRTGSAADLAERLELWLRLHAPSNPVRLKPPGGNP